MRIRLSAAWLRGYLEGQRVCGGALREPDRQQLGSRLLRLHNDKSL